MSWTIYIVTHRGTGRCYVGLTSQTLAHRWAQHAYRARSGQATRFYNAIRTYGIAEFSIATLEVLSTLAVANEREAYWIDTLDTVGRGFNAMPGGLAYEPHKLAVNPWDDPVFRAKQMSTLLARNALATLVTHCKHGHEFTPENTKRTSAGYRACRACLRVRTAAWQKANRVRVPRHRNESGRFVPREAANVVG